MRYIEKEIVVESLVYLSKEKKLSSVLDDEKGIRLWLSGFPQLEITKEYKVKEVEDADN